MPVDAHPFMVEFTLTFPFLRAQRFPRIKYQTIDHNDSATFLTGHLLHTFFRGIFFRGKKVFLSALLVEYLYTRSEKSSISV